MNQASARIRLRQNLRSLLLLQRGARHAHRSLTDLRPSPSRSSYPPRNPGPSEAPLRLPGTRPVAGTIPAGSSVPFRSLVTCPLPRGPPHPHHERPSGHPLATSVSSTGYPGPTFASLSAAWSSLQTPGVTTSGTGNTHREAVGSSGWGAQSLQCERCVGAVTPQQGVDLTSSCRGQVCSGLPAALPGRGGQCLLAPRLPSSILAWYFSALPRVRTDSNLPLP